MKYFIFKLFLENYTKTDILPPINLLPIVLKMKGAPIFLNISSRGKPGTEKGSDRVVGRGERGEGKRA